MSRIAAARAFNGCFFSRMGRFIMSRPDLVQCVRDSLAAGDHKPCWVAGHLTAGAGLPSALHLLPPEAARRSSSSSLLIAPEIFGSLFLSMREEKAPKVATDAEKMKA